MRRAGTLWNKPRDIARLFPDAHKAFGDKILELSIGRESFGIPYPGWHYRPLTASKRHNGPPMKGDKGGAGSGGFAAWLLGAIGMQM